jgi:mRNA interferase RelE/StbE
MRVVLEKSATKYFERLSTTTKRRINDALSSLTFEPPQGDIKKLHGRNDYRLRVGDYRILYRVETDMVIITNIAPRGQAYKE